MKPIFFASALLLAASATGGPAAAQNYPWCSIYGGSMGGSKNCGFVSFDQCMANVSGIGGFCQLNNTYVPSSPAHRSRRARH